MAKLTKLKVGYSLHMSNKEFELYQRAMRDGFGEIALDEDMDDPVTNYFANEVNGTEKVSSWFVVKEDRQTDDRHALSNKLITDALKRGDIK
tara:strand:+ start:254 stop:529 length:276 start_codon:yes stop_codon:yes gene_type:complete